MIILPDRNIARQTKFLMPMHRREWYSHGDANIHFQTWIAQAFRSDHSMVWHGHFEDRDDADAFMWALYSGTLKQDRYLQRLPRYAYMFDQRQIPFLCPSGFDPDMLDDLGIMYNVVTNIGIGPSSGNYLTPGDCYGVAARAGEFIDCIGPGGSAGCAAPAYLSTGGGGGGFGRTTVRALNPNSNYPFVVGSGGAQTGTTGGQVVGNGGTAHTYFWDPSIVQGNAGAGGSYGAAPPTGGGIPGGAGGGAAGAVQAAYTGGRGGNCQVNGSYGSCATGGGAAAGPGGNGVAGTNTVGPPAGQATAGGAGQGLVYGPWGPGGGGAGAVGPNGVAGGAGGYYGGGGGAACNSQSTTYTQYGGAGAGGLIVIRYEPQYAPTVSSITPNSGPTGGGQAVRIGGSFVGVTSANIGGAPLTGMTYNSTDVYGTTSAGAAGTYNVNVHRSGGPSPGVGSNLYTYVTPPSLSGCNPPIGLQFGGTAVTLTGANLAGTTGVTFNGVAATSVVVVNSTTITCVTPAGAPGLATIAATNAYGTASLSAAFTYLKPSAGFNMPMMGI